MQILIKILFICIALLTASSADCQEKSLIPQIRKEYLNINANKFMQKKTLRNKDYLGYEADGGSSLTGYFKKGKLVKIVSWAGISHGIHIDEYYFKDGKLIFVYKKFNSFPYDAQKNRINMKKTTTTFEGRYYFNDDKLIDIQIRGENISRDKQEDEQKQLLNEADNYRTLLQ